MIPGGAFYPSQWARLKGSAFLSRPISHSTVTASRVMEEGHNERKIGP